MRNICLMSDAFPPEIDGVANSVVNYARVLHDSGYGLNVVTPEFPNADDSAFDYPIIRYPGIDLSRKVGYVAGNPFSPSTLKRLETMDIDLIHSHCPAVSNMLAMELRTLIDKPMVLTYHTRYEIEIKKNLKNPLVDKMVTNILVDSVSSCDELWVVSRGAGESLRKVGYKGDYIVMENGVDLKRHRAEAALVDEVSRGYDLPAGVPVFLFVGRLEWYKGIRIILDALATLQSQKLDFRMVFVGKGMEEKEIKAYVEKLGLSGKCFFTGALHDRERIAAWYTRADLFLFPSTFDTNGLVVREAAACSLGSVLIRDSCASEGISDGVDGLLIDENADSLAECLKRVLGHPELMKSLGQKASENIYLSWDDAIKKAMDRYEIVIDNYKKGLYPKHKKPINELFSFSGRVLG